VTITAALVLFSVIWFMVFLIVLPIRLETQGDRGEVVPGTHRSSPTDPRIGRRALITTGVSVVLFLLIGGIIVSGIITIDDLDVFRESREAFGR
jgi:predicted secreted protein